MKNKVIKYPCIRCGKKGVHAVTEDYHLNDCSKCRFWKAWIGDNVAGTFDPEDKEIRKGVFGRDLIQPRNEDGSVNQKFVDRYGDGILKGGKSQLDGQGKNMKKVHQKTDSKVGIDYKEI